MHFIRLSFIIIWKCTVQAAKKIDVYLYFGQNNSNTKCQISHYSGVSKISHYSGVSKLCLTKQNKITVYLQNSDAQRQFRLPHMGPPVAKAPLLKAAIRYAQISFRSQLRGSHCDVSEVSSLWSFVVGLRVDTDVYEGGLQFVDPDNEDNAHVRNVDNYLPDYTA
jgi:hypothetical protein